MGSYSLVIFDFDGTIASSLSSYISIYNILAKEHKLRIIRKKDLSKLKNLPPQKIISLLNISYLQLPLLFLEGRKLMSKFESKIELVPGIKKVITKIAKKTKLIILTSNSKKYVERFLAAHNMNYFSEIWSELNIFGKDQALKKILTKYHLKPQDVLYIADEVRDIVACKKVGIAVASVTWGFNSKKILKKESPTYLVNSPEKLLKLLKI